MLDELNVRDYALIRSATLTFAPGCTVLTGETGAGKTALIGAIKLLIGERGDVTAVADGASELRVEARFIEEGVVGSTSGNNGGSDGNIASAPTTDREHIVTRRLSRDGRSRCTLDDSMVTVGVLAQEIGPLVELYGQHDHQSLLAASKQLAYLDRYGKTSTSLTAYQDAFRAQTAAAARLHELDEAAHTSKQTLDNARFTCREIEAVNPLPDEHETLEARLPILRNGESLATASYGALKLLRDEGGALEKLAEAQRALAHEGGVDPRLDGLALELESLNIAAEDSAASLRDYHASVDFDPQALEAAYDRLGQLESLRKRFGPRMHDVFVIWEDAKQQLSLTDSREEAHSAAQAAQTQAEQELSAAAAALSEQRSTAAAALTDALSASLQDLAMEGAHLSWSVRPLKRDAWTLQGSEQYELLYQPAQTSTPRPLAKIASGGELSRVMLALKSLDALTEGKPTPPTPSLPCGEQPAMGASLRDEHAATLVFDEIDAGIGGAAASAVAERIRALAEHHQVIIVTHLAQLAAIAERQYVVEKRVKDGTAETSIHSVEGEQRVAEIARMLAGSTDDTALTHARKLLGL